MSAILSSRACHTINFLKTVWDKVMDHFVDIKHFISSTCGEIRHFKNNKNSYKKRCSISIFKGPVSQLIDFLSTGFFSMENHSLKK